jgi:hypothetical protein
LLAPVLYSQDRTLETGNLTEGWDGDVTLVALELRIINLNLGVFVHRRQYSDQLHALPSPHPPGPLAPRSKMHTGPLVFAT